MAARDYYGVVQELYVTYFGRPADHFGLLNFAAKLDALNAPTDLAQLNVAVQADKSGTGALSQLVNSFSSAPESHSLYGAVDAGNDTTVSKFVLAIYKNLLGRSPDSEGFDFWVTAIKSGALTPANAAAAIADATQTNTSEQGIKDAARIQKAVAVASDFTSALTTQELQVSFAGDASTAASRSLLANVSDTTDVAAYHTAVIELVRKLGSLMTPDAGTIITLNGADPGTVDVVTTLSTEDTHYGTVDVPGGTTIRLQVNDTDTSHAVGHDVNTANLTLKDATLKSLVISGNANLNLALDAADDVVTSIDGSAAGGKLAIVTLATAKSAVTVIGSAQDDTLLATHANDVLQGGAGNDTLIAGTGANLVTLTGGAGNDTFDVSHASGNVNGYATLADVSTNDVIRFMDVAGHVETFSAARLALGATAALSDYANEAIHSSSQGAITWFQFGGNTYVVENASGATSFVGGTDLIVKIAGKVDLGAASFSADHQTLLIG